MSRSRDIMVSTNSQSIQRTGNTHNHYSQKQTESGTYEHPELDWRYLSTTEAYSSEYSAASEGEEDDDYNNDDNQDEPLHAIATATVKETNILQTQRIQGARGNLLVASSPASSGLFATSPGTHEGDDSTDTIKSMRARTLDKINGRKGSSSNMTSSYTNGSNNTNTNSGVSSIKRATITATTTSSSSSLGTSSPYLNNRPVTSQDEKVSARESGQISSTKTKRRSFGQSTADRLVTNRVSIKTSQQELRHNSSSTQQSHIRKRNSGSFKSQQVPLTSDDEALTGNENVTAKTRSVPENGGMLDELKSLKARVQELEMERMNRSLTGLHVQSPQAMTPRTELPEAEDQLSMSHSEKLQHIIQKHRGSSSSLETYNPVRSPTLAVSSLSREKASRGSGGSTIKTAASTGDLRLKPSAKIDNPLRPKSSPSTQHIKLLQEAFKTFERAVEVTGSPNGHAAVLALSKVVSNTVSMNQTIRTLIMADVTLVDSSSMSSLQRACDEQVRNLTESMLEMAAMQSAPDRSLSQSDIAASAGMAMNRPYSPRLSTGPSNLTQGQRISLAMAGNELGGRAVAEQNFPYPTRPLSAAAFNTNYDPAGSVTPNAMSSSGYWTRNSSVSSSGTTEPRFRVSRQGYQSDFSHNRQASANGAAHSRHSGAISGRESSPPQENSQMLDQRSHVYGPVPQHSFNGMESPHLQNSPQQHHMGSTSSFDMSLTDAPSQLARRQASVRNIMARFSQSGHRSPTFDQRSQDHGIHMNPNQDNSMSASIDFSSSGHARVSSSRRPLSQQDHYGYPDSTSSMGHHIRQGTAVHRSGRYANDRVFSDDESIGGWGAASVDHFPQRSKTGSYALRAHHLRGRLDQMQPLHQQLEQFDRIEAEQAQYNEHIQQQQQEQQQQQGEFMDGAETVMFVEGQHLSFNQRRQPQRDQYNQQYHDMEHHKNMQRQPHQMHQDMMMTTPSMPSPNSSPSSSSRLDAPSLASSNSHHGGLASIDARYNLSPRGPADSSTFPRQMSMGSISGFSDDSVYMQPQQQQLQQLQQQQQLKRVSQANGRGQYQAQLRQQKSSHLDGLSPQAQARLQQVMAES